MKPSAKGQDSDPSLLKVGDTLVGRVSSLGVGGQLGHYNTDWKCFLLQRFKKNRNALRIGRPLGQAPIAI